MSYKKFVSSERVDRALQSGNIRIVKQLLVNVCKFDRTFSTGEFEDAMEYVCKVKGVNIFEPLDETLMPLYSERVDRNDPTLGEDDFTASAVCLMENFCPERIEDTKKLGRYLFPDEMHSPKPKPEPQPRVQPYRPSGTTARESGASYKSSTQRTVQNPPKSGQTKKVWPLVAGGVAVAAVLLYLWVK